MKIWGNKGHAEKNKVSHEMHKYRKKQYYFLRFSWRNGWQTTGQSSWRNANFFLRFHNILYYFALTFLVNFSTLYYSLFYPYLLGPVLSWGSVLDLVLVPSRCLCQFHACESTTFKVIMLPTLTVLFNHNYVNLSFLPSSISEISCIVAELMPACDLVKIYHLWSVRR